MRSSLALLPLLVACASQPADKAKGEPATVTSAAAQGVSHPALAELLTAHWEWTLQRDPIYATRLGDHRYDDRIADRSEAARDEDRRRTRELHARGAAIAASELDERDRTTLVLFLEMLESQIEVEVCAYDEWSISARNNPIAEWNGLAELHAVKTRADGENLVARYRKVPAAIDTTIANLERGAARGAYANAESVRRALVMVETQLEKPTGEWPVLAPARAAVREGWTRAEHEAFAKALGEAAEELRAPLQRYASLLKTKLLPKARSDASPGLSTLPFGKACYAAQIERYTTLSPAPSPEELHELGKRELARINGEMEVLGEKLFGTRELAKVLEKLRTDPALYFTTDREVEDAAKRALDAARAKMGDYFGILPKADCVVVRIPDYEAPFSTVAYYREPVPDGSKPGEYFVNVLQPETRTRYEAEALAFHESIPGHHLQIAIAQELPALPSFRKHLHMTAFIEGWALYSEQLADEMGLYSGDLDRLGKLSYESWRASRLVVDTGLHAMGWSREAAKAYMLAHTALAPNNIDNEVDRYIVWPGQALAYKTGQLEISRLRAHAEKALGGAFELAAFHDTVLGRGSVSLPVLRAQVEAWITSRSKLSPSSNAAP